MATAAPGTWEEYCRQILQGAKDVILSTKTMMLLVNAGGSTADSCGSSQVAMDTKKLILVMFSCGEKLDSLVSESTPAFTKQFLTETAKALRDSVMKLIKACKEKITNPDDAESYTNLNQSCRSVGEVLKDIMLLVQQSPAPSPAASPLIPASIILPITSHTRRLRSLEGDDEDDDDDGGAEEDYSHNSTSEIEGDEEELDFVVNALNVFAALDEFRSELKLQARKNFSKSSSNVMSCTTSLVEAAQAMRLSQSTPKIKGILDSFTQQSRTVQTTYDDAGLRKQIDQTARELETAVGLCVDEFRALNNIAEGDDADSMGNNNNNNGSNGLAKDRSLFFTRNSRMIGISCSPPHSSSMPCPIIGGSLDVIMKRQREHSPTLKVPSFFRHLVTFIRKSGVETPGLFQVVAPAAEVENIVSSINTGVHVELTSDTNVHVATNLLKRFLTCLPVPLIGTENMIQLCAQMHAAPPNAVHSVISSVISGLPQTHQHILADLFALLHEVAKSSLPSSDVLANIFHPILCPNTRGGSPSKSELQAIKAMIEYYEEIFKPQLRFTMISRSNSEYSPLKSFSTGGGGAVGGGGGGGGGSTLSPKLSVNHSTLNPTPAGGVGVPPPRLSTSSPGASQILAPPPPGATSVSMTARAKLRAHFINLSRKALTRGGSSSSNSSGQEKSRGKGSAPATGPSKNAPYRLCIVGEEAAGKTAFVQRILYDTFVDFYEPTVDETYKKTITIGKEESEVEILDISGNHFIKHAYQKWFTWGEGFIILYDITSQPSFKAVSYWLEEISKARGSNSFPFIIAGSHLDAEDLNLREVKLEYAQQALQETGYYDSSSSKSTPIIEFSSKTCVNVDKIIPILAADILVQQKIKKTFFKKMIGGSFTNIKTRHGGSSSTPNKHRSSRGHVQGASSQSDATNASSAHIAIPQSPAGNARSLSSSPGHSSKMTMLKRSKGVDKKSLDGHGDTGVDDWLTKPLRTECWIEGTHEQDLNQISVDPNRNSVGATAASPPCVEVVSSVCKTEEGYHIESWRGDITSTLPEPDPNEPYPIECPSAHTPYYKLHFVGNDHINYCGEDPLEGPVILSFIRDPSGASCKVIVRTKKEERRLIAQTPSSRKDVKKDVLRYVSKTIPALHATKWTEIKDQTIISSLSSYEEKLVISRYKFGVLLCLDGQVNENDMFGNVDSTPEFDHFLSLLGDQIVLKGWKGFRGGLDVVNNATGTHSVYTAFRNLEIMFHVSTLLPYQHGDEQRVERKRHIGNDIVNIIFKQGSAPFNPMCITTHFTHVFCVVQEDEALKASTGIPHYRIAFANRAGVRPYQPFISTTSVFPGNGPRFREFMLTKLINSERAAIEVPEFKNKMIRTRKTVLEDLVQKYVK